MRSCGLVCKSVNHRGHEDTRRKCVRTFGGACPRTRFSIPTIARACYFQMTRSCGDGALPRHRGAEPRRHTKFGMMNASNSWGLTPAELRKLRSLKTPHGIQRLLDDMPYHLADTAWSPRRVLHENPSPCFLGGLLA